MIRTLLVDTNRAAFPIYQYLCELGHEVWVVGADPSEPLAKLSPNFQRLDYSDTLALGEFVNEMAFDHLVPGCTDVSLQVCAAINQGRFPGIDEPEIIDALHTKSRFRTLGAEIGLSVPRVFTESREIGDTPVVVKPVDSFSGRGIQVLNRANLDSLTMAVEQARKASPSASVLIEEYVEGQLCSHSAFLSDGEIVADYFVQEDGSTHAFTVDTSRVFFEFPKGMQKLLRQDLLRLSENLGLKRGLVHTQFIMSGNRFWIIEVTRRCPGDLYSLLIEYSTGYRYAEAYTAPFIGQAPPKPAGPEIEERIIRHTATSPSGLSLTGIQLSRPVQIRQFVPLVSMGEKINPGPYGRAGIFFFQAGNRLEQDELYQQLLDQTLISFN